METVTGVVFDIKEFALYDGPGLRCTVFMKGCPLRCSWCHNPEGLDSAPETLRSASGSRVAGQTYTAEELAERLLGYRPVFDAVGGGVTFSGGEPLLQAAFVDSAMRLLKGKVEILLQTSGCAREEAFLRVAGLADLVFFDLKPADAEKHKQFCGRDNRRILSNLVALNRSGARYRLRMPMIPGVTDTRENYAGLREFIRESLSPCNAEGLDLLPYNPAAGGKYAGVGREFAPGFDTGRRENIQPKWFRDLVREVTVL